LILALLDIHVASLVALLVLGYGDPMAAIIGRRFGRTKLVNGRSLEGTSAFVVAGGLVGTLALTLCYPTLPFTAALATAFAGAFVGSLAELFSRRIDDNFSIPLTAAAAATVTLHLLGYSA
jgi:dolichol kinase